MYFNVFLDENYVCVFNPVPTVLLHIWAMEYYSQLHYITNV